MSRTIAWNFAKFLVTPDLSVVEYIAPLEPQDKWEKIIQTLLEKSKAAI